jgi:hypothetical protein
VLNSAGSQPPKGSSATAVVKINAVPERDLSDEEFSWHMTNFHIWPGEHCPVLKRQVDMGLAIRTTDDDLEECRTS